MADALRPRSLQTEIGPSDCVCERRAGYVLHRTPKTDQVDKRKALLGTIIHKGVLEPARTHFRWIVEREVTDGPMRGHPDIVQLDTTTARGLPWVMRPRIPAEVCTLEEVKSKPDYVWERVLAYGATRYEIRQATLYAGMLRENGFADIRGQKTIASLGPIAIERIRFRFIHRGTGEERVQEFAHDGRLLAEARWWVQRVRESERPEDLRRDFPGPGLSPMCDQCPFRTACWGGAPPGRAPQSVLVSTDAERIEAIAEYMRASADAAAATARRDFARAKVDGMEAGRYGDLDLSWRGGNPQQGVDVEALVDWYELADLVVPLVPDVAEMKAVLKAAGIPIPRRPTGARTARQIHVAAVPEPQALE
ncbi:hypothetical protein [Embleya sp. NPDC059237]|uniref:hypothetical protein n=1 Tax=Embleya sp. NPDC059237 TaxID=3346784 RepID=UPI003683743C